MVPSTGVITTFLIAISSMERKGGSMDRESEPEPAGVGSTWTNEEREEREVEEEEGEGASKGEGEGEDEEEVGGIGSVGALLTVSPNLRATRCLKGMMTAFFFRYSVRMHNWERFGAFFLEIKREMKFRKERQRG